MKQYVRDMNSGNGLIFEDENKNLTIYFDSGIVLIGIDDDNSDFTHIELGYPQFIELLTKLMPLVVDKVKNSKKL
jgi:hypothetical protein